MSDVKETGRCERCNSPSGKITTVEGVSHIVCNECLGFMARWFLEQEEKRRVK